MNEDDLKAYAYMVEDSLTKPELFQLAIEQLSDALVMRESEVAAMLLGCYSWSQSEGSVKVFLVDWLNEKVEAMA